MTAIVKSILLVVACLTVTIIFVHSNKKTLPEKYRTNLGQTCYIIEKCRGLPADTPNSHACYVCTR